MTLAIMKLAAFPLMFILALLFVLAVVLVVLLAKGGKVGRYILITLPFAFALLVLFLVFMPVYVWRHAAHESASVAILQAEAEPTIWFTGMQDQFKADVYPSKTSAVRSLGLQIARPVREVLGRDIGDDKIAILEANQPPSLVAELRRAATEALPDGTVVAHSDPGAPTGNALVVYLDLPDIEMSPSPWPTLTESDVASGVVSVRVAGPQKESALTAKFAEKPWVEDITAFLNARSPEEFVLARSTETCTSQDQANEQALQDALRQLKASYRRVFGATERDLARKQLRVEDLMQGDFIVDRFVQSFDGTAGKIWRQAFLIDASEPKLARLFQRKTKQADATRATWARKGTSVIGTVLLIILVYVLLNTATKGYYVWSLRIAGILLALVGIASVLFVFR